MRPAAVGLAGRDGRPQQQGDANQPPRRREGNDERHRPGHPGINLCCRACCDVPPVQAAVVGFCRYGGHEAPGTRPARRRPRAGRRERCGRSLAGDLPPTTPQRQRATPRQTGAATAIRTVAAATDRFWTGCVHIGSNRRRGERRSMSEGGSAWASGPGIPEDTATRFGTLAREFGLSGADLVGMLVARVVGVDADLRRVGLHGLGLWRTRGSSRTPRASRP